jgi:opacity protein-like surface antigen
LVDTSSDEKDSTLGLYGGYTFAKHFAIELSYTDLGESSFTTVRDIELGLPFPFPFPATPAPAPVFAFRPYNPQTPFYSVVAAGTAAFRSQQTMTFDSEALALTLLGRYELGRGFSVLGRAGIAVHRIKTDIEVSTNGLPSIVVGGVDESSAGAAVLGVGGEWSFHANWAVRLQAQRHFLLEEEDINLVERGDVTMMTAGIEYRF